MEASKKNLKKQSSHVKKTLLTLGLSSLLWGFSAPSHAGIFDDIKDVFDDAVDQLQALFSSAENVAESVVEQIDTHVIDNIRGRCTLVKVDNADGDTATKTVMADCGHGITELSDVFEQLGGHIAQQSRQVHNALDEVGKEAWEQTTEPFANAVKEVVSFYAEAVFDPVVKSSKQLLSLMADAKNTLASIKFANGQLASGSSVSLSYTLPLPSAADLQFELRGVVSRNMTSSKVTFVGLNGELIAQIKSKEGLGYTPQAAVKMTYTNPIIRLEKGKITGLFVFQPDGGLSLSALVSPLQLSASLSQLMQLPGLKNINVLRKTGDAIGINADIGTLNLTLPLTNQTDNRFRFNLEVSGGIEASIAITNKWKAKIMEEVTWNRDISLDIPAIQLPLSALPASLISELEASDSAPSYAEQIVSYQFNNTNSNVIADQSGYGNHAIMVGGVSLKDGVAYLNGKDGYIDLPDNLMESTDAISVYAEVYINENQATPYFIYGLGNSKGDWGDGYLFTTGDVYRSALSTCHWICEQSTFNEHLNLPRGAWQKLVYTVKDKVATLYLNGDIVSQHTDMTLKPSDIGHGKTTANYIGRSVYQGDHYFNGAIRHFEIWKGALTPQEIAQKFGNRNTSKLKANTTVN